MKETPSKAAQWLSFHAFLGSSADDFLVHFLTPFLQSSAADVKRFFFIRHSDDGLHLRLRFKPCGPKASERISAGLNGLVDSLSLSQGEQEPQSFTVRQVPYDRSLYFGDNLDSAYAELLNEQTSYLALKLLASSSDTQRKFVSALSALFLLYGLPPEPREGTLPELEESISFVQEAAAQAGIVNSEAPAVSDALTKRLRELTLANSKQLRKEEAIHTIGRLLVRAKQHPNGRTVATHALHLLCNKLGFTLPDEYNLLVVLKLLFRKPDRQIGLQSKAHSLEDV